MPIRFACPSCRQPIEVDEQWAGQSVACPYCRNVVTAPASSNWPGAEVPMATPAGGPFSPPPPPQGTTATYPVQQPRSALAAWALTISLTAAALAILGWIVWAGLVHTAYVQKFGTTTQPTQQQMQQFTQDLMSSGKLPTSPFSKAAVILGLLCSIGGLVLGIASLVRDTARRGMAIFACVISILFLLCQLPLGLFLLAATAPPGTFGR